MNRIILASHGGLSAGMKDTVQMILGELPKLYALATLRDATEPITVSAPDAVVAGDTLTIHGVTYTIDRSAVDMRRAEITFVFADSSAQTSVYGAGDIGTAFPTDGKRGYTFDGWKIGDKTYTTLTEEALTKLNGT